MTYDWSRKSHPQYDPGTGGFGNRKKWKKSFSERMSMDEAEEILQDSNPYTVLNFPKDGTLEMLKKIYRMAAIANHPDKHPANEQAMYTDIMQRINAAYTILKSKFE